MDTEILATNEAVTQVAGIIVSNFAHLDGRACWRNTHSENTMKLLQSIAPLVADGGEILLKVTRARETLSVLVTPKLAGFKPETEDEVLARLQSALALPVLIKVPAEPDPDAALAEALQELAEARSPVLNQLSTYRASLEEAAAAAKVAEQKKGEKKAEKGSKSPKPAPAKGKAGKSESAASETLSSALPAEAAEPASAGTDLFAGAEATDTATVAP